MSDLVERLKRRTQSRPDPEHFHTSTGGNYFDQPQMISVPDALCQEAAARIAALEAENAKLNKLLADGQKTMNAEIDKISRDCDKQVTDAMDERNFAQQDCQAFKTEITRLTTELSCARAAMAKEAAEWHSKQIEEISRLLRHGNANSDGEIQMVMERIFHGTSHEAILALADVPAGYVCVKMDEQAATRAIENAIQFMFPFFEHSEDGGGKTTVGKIEAISAVAKAAYNATITKATP